MKKGSDGRKPTKEAIEFGTAQGFDVVQGDTTHMNLDLDTPEDLSYYQDKALLVLQNYISIREIKRWKSKSGIGTHVVLELDAELPVAVRIALQAVLGSDRMRELYGIVKVIADATEEPSILFRPKGENGVNEAW